MRSLAFASFVLAAIALAACGGKTYIYETPPPNFPTPTLAPTNQPTGQPTLTPTSTVSFNVIVPNISGSARVRPHVIVPAASLSVAIQLDSVNGTVPTTPTPPLITNLSASTAGCQQTSTQLSCVINVAAPVGALIYTLTVYNATNAGGSSLGAGNLAVTTTGGATVVAPATLSGTVAKIVVSVGGAALGVNATVPVTVQAEDANSSTVLGNYTSPITLTDTDASGQTLLSSSAGNVTSGATVVTLDLRGRCDDRASHDRRVGVRRQPGERDTRNVFTERRESHGQRRDDDICVFANGHHRYKRGTDQSTRNVHRHVHPHGCDRANLRHCHKSRPDKRVAIPGSRTPYVVQRHVSSRASQPTTHGPQMLVVSSLGLVGVATSDGLSRQLRSALQSNDHSANAEQLERAHRQRTLHRQRTSFRLLRWKLSYATPTAPTGTTTTSMASSCNSM